ncbi:beta-lactamase-like protein [Thelonectria olida]|uniref:Beta-lactamase-like protein n=1 Tax=Thelonectria olida TaxID=1576542 RepID=A0A9P9AN32_9HYPO|nr:beta-lactamase-like protein [Thelonectria olida]
MRIETKHSSTPSLDDRRDYEDADRGFIAALKPGVIKNADGKVVWDVDEYKFLKENCPPTAHPHLWRQGQLCAKQGLYEIQPRIYQVRGLDISNMTIVEGNSGIIVIDPLISCECAAAALQLYQDHRGNKPIAAVLYSHSHGDHYMGAGGIINSNQDVPIFGPEGFVEAVLSESILAGPAMRRRAAFMYGNALPRRPDGQIGVGLGLGSSTGSTSLILPNILIQKTGEEHMIDGVRFVFQMVPGTEAPAELNFHLPDFRALCIPETSTNCMHNIVTLRGAQVRDAKAWSRYLDEAIWMFGAESDVVFGSHHWPTWGRDALITRLSEQRDMFGYLHDQTVRMMNLGMTGLEIAETIQMPPAIARAWHCQGFYGSLSHNVKGIYQKYLTWFDGHPAYLWQYPAALEGQRYVRAMGGVDELCRKAEEFIEEGDSRFAATLLAHAVAAHPDDNDSKAKGLLARAYENLGFGTDNATWRNFYLTGAQELRTGENPGKIVGGKTPLGSNLSVDQWFAILSVQIDGERAAKDSFAIDISISDIGQKWRLMVSNGVLTHRRLLNNAYTGPPAGLEMTLTRDELLDLLKGKGEKPEKVKGDFGLFTHLLDLMSIEQLSADQLVVSESDALAFTLRLDAGFRFG